MAKHFQVDTGATLTTSLVSYWKLDGNSSDFYGSNSGSDTNMSYTTGKVGNAASFNGSSSVITVSDNASLNFTTAISFATWVKKGASNLFGFTAVKRISDGNQQYNFGL